MKNCRFCRVAQEPNRNRKPEPSEPFFPPKAEPEPPEPFPETETGTGTVLSCENLLKYTKTRFAEEPPEPKTGTARTVPLPNRNRTEPNRGLPDFGSFSTPFWTGWTPGPRGPGNSFLVSFFNFGPEGPKVDPCSRFTESQAACPLCIHQLACCPNIDPGCMVHGIRRFGAEGCACALLQQ